MKQRYIWFGLLAAFYIYKMIQGEVISYLIVLGILSYILYFTNSIESKYKKDGALTTNEKISIWVTVFLNPIVAVGFYYYCWKKEMPMRAAQANKIGWIAFAILVLVGFAIGFSGVFK